MRSRSTRVALLATCVLLPAAVLLRSSLAQTLPSARTVPQVFENPAERTAPLPRVDLAPPVQTPPLTPQTGPGASAEVRIGSVRLTGNEALPDAALAPALEGLAGAQVPLSRIEEARVAILHAYREAGYPFAGVNAGLIPLPGGDADLVLRITEGYIAEVRLEGDVGPAGTQVLRFLNRLLDQRPVTSAALERALLLAGDIPGLTVRGTLRPLPTAPGALQLVARVERKAVSGFFSLDNRGSSFVGPWQGLLVAGLNAFSSFGERTEIALYSAELNEQVFGQASIEAFLGGSGLRLRVFGGAGEVRPSGSVFAGTGYYGRVALGGAVLSYPIIRSRSLNLYAIGQFDIFEGEISQGGTVASRDRVRSLRGGVDLQLLEDWVPFLPAATTIGSVRISQGIAGLGATRGSSAVPPSRAGSDFGFTKIAGEVQRTQPLFSPFPDAMVNLQGLLAGQWTDDVLPQSEKFFLGGARLGRGYYVGQVTADRAWGLALELQLDLAFRLPTDPVIGSGNYASQLYLFRDIARGLQTNEEPDQRLSSWGGGVRRVVSEAVQFDLEGVHRVVRRPGGAATDRLRETAVFFRTLVRF